MPRRTCSLAAASVPLLALCLVSCLGTTTEQPEAEPAGEPQTSAPPVARAQPATPSQPDPPSAPAAEAVAPVTPGEAGPWGGLEVTMVGVPIAQADRVVLLFHGYGAPGDDMLGLARRLQAGSNAAFLLPAGPHVLPSGGRCWARRDGEGLDESRSAVLEALAQVDRECGGCSIIVGGFSQGGMLASTLLAAPAAPIAAAVLFSPSSAPEPVLDLEVATPAPTFIIHGRQDDVVAYQEAVNLRVRLEAAGVKVTFVPMDAGHAIPNVALAAASRFLRQLSD